MADSEINLRPARPGDAPAIAEIWQVGWRDGHLGRVPEQLVAVRDAESFRTRAVERVDDTTVAEVGGELAGFVMVVADELEQAYVAGSHRGTGVADRLIAEAERQIGAGGHPTAWLAVVPGNARARRCYERNGWIDAGPFSYEASADRGTVAVPCHRYEKALTSPSAQGSTAPERLQR